MKTESVLNPICGRGVRSPVSVAAWIGLKHAVVLVFLVTGSVVAFGQGKVSLQMDLPIIMGDSAHLFAADAALAGQPVPNIGPLASGISLVVGLYGGTASGNLSLQTTVMLNPAGGNGSPAGFFPITHCMLTNIPGGSWAYFQVKIWDSTYASYEAQMASGQPDYAAINNIFQMIPGTSISYPPITSGGSSTWTAVGNEVSMVVGAGGGYPDLVTIWQQPMSQAVVRGHIATFAVGASSNHGYPLSYQWSFNGTAIPGAGSSSYQVTNAQPANAGTYRVLVGDCCSLAAVSVPATLTVLVPPSINSPPQTQTAELGKDVGLDAAATGDSPLLYQWFFNSTNALVSGTSSHLQLTNLQFEQSGVYTVVVTNAGGAATSPPGLLNVISRVERRTVPALNLRGQPGTILNLDFTAALEPAPLWTTFDHAPLVAASRWYFDVRASLPPRGFYRAWQYTPGAPSVLSLNFVPALALSGPIGSSLRVDYINQFGPIDAWFTNLATITLTNTSQLYFDTSVIGQPPRLWRIVPVP